MAFEREPVRTPVAIGDVEITLFSPDPEGDGQASSSFAVRVKYNDGSSKVLQGNLTPHLTQAQINSLLGFMASMRTKAEGEILPEG